MKQLPPVFVLEINHLKVSLGFSLIVPESVTFTIPSAGHPLKCGKPSMATRPSRGPFPYREVRGNSLGARHGICS